MSKQDYADYEAAVAAFIAREGLSFLSTTTEGVNDAGQSDGNQDPWFSWHPCECCGSHLGGDREYLYARNASGKVVRFTICTDCVYYIEYGRLDDTTMARVNEA
jgi:hypothetical protein